MSGTQEEAQLELLRSRLRADPNDGQSWLELAQLLSHRPPGTELFHTIEQAIISLPEETAVWSLAADIQHGMRGPDAALQWLEQTAGDNPALAAPQLVLASLHSRSHPDAAIARCERIVEQFTGNKPDAALQARSIRADIYRQIGHWQDALDEYRKLEMAGAADPQLLNNIGCCLAGLEEFSAASEYFKQALSTKPDFSEAKLNLGLLYATQLKDRQAISVFNEALQSQDMDPATRGAAENIRDIMLEHQRLEPAIQQSVASASIEPMQIALAAAPKQLLQPHSWSLEKLRQLAKSCQAKDFDSIIPAGAPDNPCFPFIEAWTQCKIPGGLDEMVTMNERLKSPGDTENLLQGELAMRNYLQAIEDRRQFPETRFTDAGTTAWLRYWHARLMGDTPKKLPGQFKAIPNAIGRQTLTPPENVAGTFHALLSEIRPQVTNPRARAIFMYLAITMVHGFADGNGRMSRFFLAFEAEWAGIQATAISVDLRRELAASLDVAWIEGSVEPLAVGMAKAHQETLELQSELRQKLDYPA